MLPRGELFPEDYIELSDAIADQYKEVIQDGYYRYKLPSSMLDAALPIMQEQEVLPIKNIPLYSVLKKRCYGRSVEFFVNNLPSFKQYREQDDISWIVTERRLLATEMLEFYKDKEPSLSTLEYRIKSILYVIRLAYRTKSTPIYKLFSELVYQLHALAK